MDKSDSKLYHTNKYVLPTVIALMKDNTGSERCLWLQGREEGRHEGKQEASWKSCRGSHKPWQTSEPRAQHGDLREEVELRLTLYN